MKISHIALTFFMLFIFPVLFSQNTFAVELQFINSFGISGMNNGELFYPYQISLTRTGELIIIDKKPSIQFFNIEGNFISSWTGELPNEVNQREYMTITVDQKNNYYITLENAKKVLKYSSKKELEMEWNDKSFSWIEALLLTEEGKFYLADNNKLMLLNQQGQIEQSFEHLDLWQPLSLALSSDGNIYIADTNNNKIKVINPKGELVMEWEETGTEANQFIKPRSIAFDEKENLFVLDSEIKDDTIFSYIKIYSKTGKLLNTIELTKINPENESFFPTDFVIYQDKLYLVDMAEQCIKVYQILYDTSKDETSNSE
ncbi:hypothetical protein BBF96_01895 [Anoxybacter fermentans]|uniref:SMP-30/Gluconolactonase/LRE-like region domain-containing protein n=1 Tax=Anoxybacter fermentans TaxID=1323375 RepID=A0A3S9SVC1_9FIRM|nr:NHL repeat-containing protein [Anoxybacter fermentans]AZR72257.1 hypothetical protein BBF96_01895 [Anoxybacter fermentans]